MIMATGDNLLTSISVSRECYLISLNQEMVLCEIENGKHSDKLKLIKLEEDKNRK
jgi:magnesium-transporting ATPase (P-type)